MSAGAIGGVITISATAAIIVIDMPTATCRNTLLGRLITDFIRHLTLVMICVQCSILLPMALRSASLVDSMIVRQVCRMVDIPLQISCWLLLTTSLQELCWKIHALEPLLSITRKMKNEELDTTWNVAISSSAVSSNCLHKRFVLWVHYGVMIMDDIQRLQRVSEKAVNFRKVPSSLFYDYTEQWVQEHGFFTDMPAQLMFTKWFISGWAAELFEILN